MSAGTLNKIICEIVDSCAAELNKEKTKQKIEREVLAPVIDYILTQLKPYILGTCVFLVILTLLILSIIILIILKPSSSSSLS
jgi:hypothetical protein